MKYKRYMFYTKEADFRPLIDMKSIGMPWWCTGEYESHDGIHHRIVCYLPKEENLLNYWPDAHEIEVQARDRIAYGGRYPKPEWLKQ